MRECRLRRRSWCLHLRLRWIACMFPAVFLLFVYSYDDSAVSTVTSADDGPLSVLAEVSWKSKALSLLKKYAFCRNTSRNANDRDAQASCEHVLEPTDVFIGVKTTKRHHDTRLSAILDTWHQLFPESVYYFTDEDNELLKQKTNGHFIDTGCEASHWRSSLCCKMAVEFEKFVETNAKWFCHVDDDNYVNVPALFDLLEQYDHTRDWYIGRRSTAKPVEMVHLTEFDKMEHLRFSFATGGAGFCLSKTLVLRMKPYFSGGNFTTIGNKLRFSYDFLVGYVVEYRLKVNLTIIQEFHSHLEDLRLVASSSLKNQITLSYSGNNTITVDGFSRWQDPTRFYSLHCHLFPKYASPCP